MNKTDLIEALSERLGSRSVATDAIESVVDLILREVASGGAVGITGFGTFERVERAPRTGRNPRTGEAVPIEGASLPRFRPGNYFKDVVQDPGLLPSEGLAGIRGSGRNNDSGAANSSEGAPATVRRSVTDGPRITSEQAATPRSRASVSGTPDSVLADGQSASAEPESGRGLVGGGEEITQKMIKAKKDQLAKAKKKKAKK